MSTFKAGVNKSEPHKFVKSWLNWHLQVRLILNEREKDNINVRYEDICNNPKIEMSRIFKFLNVTSTVDVLGFYEAEENIIAAQTSYMGKLINPEFYE